MQKDKQKRFCACGCGKEITSLRKRSKFIAGHQGHNMSSKLRKQISESLKKYFLIKKTKLLNEFLTEIFKNKKTCYVVSGKTVAWSRNNLKYLWEFYYERKKPFGLCLCHTCDNPLCINIFHVFLGTKSENTKDRDLKGRQAKGEKGGLAKLTTAEVISIYKMSKFDGLSFKEIGKKFKVTGGAIYRIITRRNWRHLDLKKLCKE